MAGKRLRPRKNKAEAEAAILAARRLERPGWSMVVVLCTGRDTFGWTTAVALLAGYANILLGIVNLRRLLAGKKLF